jgi:hypothetical protein
MLIGFNKSDLTYGYRPKVDYYQAQGGQHLYRFVCKHHLIRGDTMVKPVNSICMDTP